MHDACNLAWKISLVLRGLAPARLLETYQSERLPNVQKLIDYDKNISRLMTMQLPLDWKGDPEADPNEVLGVVMNEAQSFTSGLSISFGLNSINIEGSFVPISLPAPLSPGQRAPDVQLQKPGTREPTRLHVQTPNIAKYHVVVFAGEPKHTSRNLQTVSNIVRTSDVFTKVDIPLRWITIPATSGPSAFELLGESPLGRVFYDEKQTAHARYGVDVQKGALFVLRPDGWIATAMALDQSGIRNLESYFNQSLVI